MALTGTNSAQTRRRVFHEDISMYYSISKESARMRYSNVQYGDVSDRIQIHKFDKQIQKQTQNPKQQIESDENNAVKDTDSPPPSPKGDSGPEGNDLWSKETVNNTRGNKVTVDNIKSHKTGEASESTYQQRRSKDNRHATDTGKTRTHQMPSRHVAQPNDKPEASRGPGQSTQWKERISQQAKHPKTAENVLNSRRSTCDESEAMQRKSPSHHMDKKKCWAEKRVTNVKDNRHSVAQDYGTDVRDVQLTSTSQKFKISTGEEIALSSKPQLQNMASNYADHCEDNMAKRAGTSDCDKTDKNYQLVCLGVQKVSKSLDQVSALLSGKDVDFFDNDLSKEDSMRFMHYVIEECLPDRVDSTRFTHNLPDHIDALRFMHSVAEKCLPEQIVSMRFMPYVKEKRSPHDTEIQARPVLPYDPSIFLRSRAEQLKYECLRLSTFATKKDVAVSPIRLAENGFYYDEKRGVYVCFSCNLVMTHWDRTQKNVEVVHLVLSPNCDHANGRDETNIAMHPQNTVYVGSGRGSKGTDSDRSSTNHSSTSNSPSAVNGGAAAASTRRDAKRTSNTPRDRSQPHQNGEGAERQNSVPPPQTRLLSAPVEAPPKQQHRQQQQKQQQRQEHPSRAASTETVLDNGGTASSAHPLPYSANGTTTLSESSSLMRQAGAPSTSSSARIPSAAPASSRSVAPSLLYQDQGFDTTDSRRTGSLEPWRNTSLGEQIETDGSDLAADYAESVALDKALAASPENFSAKSRFASFAGWPGQGLPHPRKLVMAGFFYMGSSDCVRCFYCGVTLQNWRENDDPWIMHVRYRFSCGYVAAVKGQEFVGLASTAAVLGRAVTIDPEVSAATQSPAETNGLGHFQAIRDGATAQRSTAAIQPGSSRSTIENRVAAPVVDSQSSVVSTGAQASTTSVSSAATGNRTATSTGTATGNRVATSTVTGNGTAAGISTASSNRTATGISAATGNRTAIVTTSTATGNTTATGTIATSTGNITTTVTASTATGNITAAVTSTAPSTHKTGPETSTPAKHGSAVGKPSPSHGSTVVKECRSAAHHANVAAAVVNGDAAYVVDEAEYRELQQTNHNLRRSMLCRMCGARDVETIFLPCGHLCTCESCSETISNCCLCGERIVGTARVNLGD